jgi:hypothetical protein
VHSYKNIYIKHYKIKEVVLKESKHYRLIGGRAGEGNKKA